MARVCIYEAASNKCSRAADAETLSLSSIHGHCRPFTVMTVNARCAEDPTPRELFNNVLYHGL